MITTDPQTVARRHGLAATSALAGGSRWRALFASLVIAVALGAGLLAGAAPALSAETAPAPTTVNINTADAATLATVLKGVGESRAVEIVRHRQMYGAFSTVDELMEVKGIGRATLDLNRAAITLE
ncbi:MAG: helix-hairpin-helix domain-containing protein [Halioglobus sp.]|nr:helix-hairpin-helix domain-containing protein [Halioglobus sp.]